MTAADYDVIVKAFAALLSLVVIPWAIGAYQKRTGVEVTDQQRAAIYHALDTGKGQIETLLDQGTLKVADVTPTHPAVWQAAKEALARVPESAASQHITTDAAAQIIVGAVNTSPKAPVIVIPDSARLAPAAA